MATLPRTANDVAPNRPGHVQPLRSPDQEAGCDALTAFAKTRWLEQDGRLDRVIGG